MLPHRKITLIRKVVNAIFFITVLFSTPSIGITGTGILNDYNPYNVGIKDNNDGEADSSDLLLSGAPTGSVITKVKVYFEIRHTWPEDLEVWLTTYYDGSWHDYEIYKQGDLGGTPDVVRTIDNITKWNGASPNQTWYLSVRDRIAQDVGYIDFFELWVDYITEEEPVIDATITIQPITAVIQDNTISVDCDVRNDGNATYSFDIGAEIEDGSTVVADLGQRTASSVNSGATKTVTFTYTIPEGWAAKDYTLHAVVWSGTPGSSDWLDDDNETFSVVARNVDASINIDPITAEQAGNSVSIPYEITNDGNVFHAFGVGAEIWKDGVKLDDVGSQTTASVSSGGTTYGSFSYDIPSSWHGIYTARCGVWSGTPGSSTWIDSYDSNFTVKPKPLSLNGRIAYHSYSNYMASPVDSTDGHVFVYRVDTDSLTKVTDGLPVENAMNPHFSPDGAKITFMAIPVGSERNRNSLEVYILDLASSSLTRLTADSVPDEDPKFSPDGDLIVWKRQGQIWRMDVDGSSQTQITTTPDEKSGPNYSPDTSNIVYWSEGSSSADIWWMSSSGTGSAEIVGSAGIQDYYPIYSDSENILYSRWESAIDHHDKIYKYNIGSGSSTRLAVNITGVEDADAAPVNGTYLVMSSTRSGGNGSYDVYVARYDNGIAYTLAAANSVHKDLGPMYSRYTFARTAALVTPANGSNYETEASLLLTVRLRSDGGVWSGASPTVIFDGPATVAYTDLKDDGTQDDVTRGDGVYSKTVTLPSTAGSYSVYASTESVEPGVTRQVVSSAVVVDISPANSPPTDINLSSTSVEENQPSGTTVGTLSTTDSDTDDTFTYTLTSGIGNEDNNSFTVADDQLKTASSFDYETKNSYSVRVRTTDQGGLWYEEAFTITVQNVNEAPTDVSLSNSTVAENQPSGAAIGTLSTIDADPNNTFIYALVSGEGSTDNLSFTINGNALQTAALFNYESNSIYNVRIRTTDQGGLWYEEAFIVIVEDVIETLKGDVNNDKIVDLEDSIMALRVLAGFQPQQPINLLADVNGDGKIGMEEVIYILRKTGGLIH